MKRLVTGLFCAALFGALVHAQAPAAPLSPDVERHIEAARRAAGTEHAGLFDAVCTTARNVIAQAVKAGSLTLGSVSGNVQVRESSADRGVTR